MSNLLVVNLFGGPGSGKSTLATGAFSLLKLAGVNCEYVPEYAKGLTWSRRSLKNQVLILGKQYDQLLRLQGQVQVAITDSPLLLTLLYNDGYESINQVSRDLYSEFWNLDFLVSRKKAYNPAGRTQTEDEAQLLDFKTRQMLQSHLLAYESVPGTEVGVRHVYERTLIELARIPAEAAGSAVQEAQALLAEAPQAA